MKKENSIRATEIMIQIPPGDYTNTKKGKKLARALSSDLSIHATIVTLMTELAATVVHEITDEKEDKPHKKFIGGVLRQLKKTLKSEQRMKDFDKFCSDAYGVSVEKPGDAPNFASDDEDLDIHIDRHLNAKS
jgi:hypothetical protein